MRNLPIFFSFDDRYVTPAAVTFESLLSNARPDVNYELFVLYENISQANRDALCELVRRHGNGTLSFIDVGALYNNLELVFDSSRFNLGAGGVSFTKETLFRCLPTLVKEFDRYDVILYSDVDICVVDDISDIFLQDLGSAYLAGCRIPKSFEAGMEHLPPRFRPNYIAGGIWLMNLRQMRLGGVEQKIIGIMKNPPFPLRWNDQDVINLACQPQVAHLSYRYCSMPRWKHELKPMGYVDEYYPSGELREALFRPKIVHYAANKPWDGPCDDDELWHYWHSRTGFPSPVSLFPEGKNVRVYLLKYLKLPDSFVRAQFRRGGLEIKIFGFLVRIRLRNMAEQ
jgi:lipopolysaccharide biosynthesis glycosyltransferase